MCFPAACAPLKRTVADVSSRRNALAAQVDTERRQRLEGDARGQLLLGQLDESNLAAAATRVIGPGLEITVTDPGMSEDLSDVSKERVPGSQQVILDRDLQQVVNSLWVSGAEAISVGGVRIGPNVTIRQAGGSILVDNQPISSPYVILAIGPPHAMQDVLRAQSRTAAPSAAGEPHTVWESREYLRGAHLAGRVRFGMSTSPRRLGSDTKMSPHT